MTTNRMDSKADVYSRPAARFDGDGNLEVRASAAGNCRRALWYAATGYEVTNPTTEESLTVLEAGNALEPVVLQAMARAGWEVTPADPQEPDAGDGAGRPQPRIGYGAGSAGDRPPRRHGGHAPVRRRGGHRGQDQGAGGVQAVARAGRGAQPPGVGGPGRLLHPGDLRGAAGRGDRHDGHRQPPVWDYEVIPAARVGKALERASEWLGQLAAHHVLHGADPDALPDRDFSAADWQCRSCPFLNVCLPGAAAEAEAAEEPATEAEPAWSR